MLRCKSSLSAVGGCLVYQHPLPLALWCADTLRCILRCLHRIKKFRLLKPRQIVVRVSFGEAFGCFVDEEVFDFIC